MSISFIRGLAIKPVKPCGKLLVALKIRKLRVRRMFASLPHDTIYNVASIFLLIASAVPLWYGRKMIKAKAEKEEVLSKVYFKTVFPQSVVTSGKKFGIVGSRTKGKPGNRIVSIAVSVPFLCQDCLPVAFCPHRLQRHCGETTGNDRKNNNNNFFRQGMS